MRRIAWVVGLMTATVGIGQAQWEMENSTTTADLRGIHSIGGGIAWASGTNGTVVRTEDGGYLWQACAVPPGAEHLDFRGIQAFDANTAVVMSSGKGELSQVYKTTDGCHSWKLVFTNPDRAGFWDAMSFTSLSSAANVKQEGVLVGDPVNNVFPVFVSLDAGDTWRRWGKPNSEKPGTCGEHEAGALKDEGQFAASNQSLLEFSATKFLFVTGGPSGARLVYSDFYDFESAPCWTTFLFARLPLASGGSSTGAFAVAAAGKDNYLPAKLMVVGGDYAKPDETSGTAVLLERENGGHLLSAFKMSAPKTPPHGYRSSVAYDADSKTWITVGPNGTDISTDDGHNWRALRPDPALHEPADADRNWNAISLPFVVGPKGRIGKLNQHALTR